MACPYLATKRVTFCMATKASYLPSLRELESFCLAAQHKNCPLYDASAPRRQTAADRPFWPFSDLR